VSKKLTAIESRQLAIEAQRVIESIKVLRTISGVRDRAIIGLMVYAGVPVDALIRMRVCDYYCISGVWWVRFLENGVERNTLIKKHSRLETFMNEYLAVSGIAKEPPSPLFRTIVRWGTRFSSNPMTYGYTIKIIRSIIARINEPRYPIPQRDLTS
jgi:site-specific recombinase XerC